MAAAIAKYKTLSSDVEVYLDDTTTALLSTNEFSTEPAQEKWLQSLGRREPVNRLVVALANITPYNTDDLSHSASLSTFKRISILFVASDPSDGVKLMLGEEVREIKEQIRLSRYRDRFDVKQSDALRPQDLSQALLDFEPQIVHFSGHGAGAQGLCFMGTDGRSHLVSSDSLSALFKEFASIVKCVILNACYSETLGNCYCKTRRSCCRHEGCNRRSGSNFFCKGILPSVGGREDVRRRISIGLCSDRT